MSDAQDTLNAADWDAQLSDSESEPENENENEESLCDLYLSKEFLERVLKGDYTVSPEDLKQLQKLDLKSADDEGRIFLCDNEAEDDGSGRCQYHNLIKRPPFADKVADWVRRGLISKAALKKRAAGRPAQRDAPKDTLPVARSNGASKQIDSTVSFAAAASAAATITPVATATAAAAATVAATAATATAATATTKALPAGARAENAQKLMDQLMSTIASKEDTLRSAEQEIMEIATSANPELESFGDAVAKKKQATADLANVDKVCETISAIIDGLKGAVPAKTAEATKATKTTKPLSSGKSGKTGKTGKTEASAVDAAQRDEILAATVGKASTVVVSKSDATTA